MFLCCGDLNNSTAGEKGLFSSCIVLQAEQSRSTANSQNLLKQSHVCFFCEKFAAFRNEKRKSRRKRYIAHVTLGILQGIFLHGPLCSLALLPRIVHFHLCLKGPTRLVFCANRAMFAGRLLQPEVLPAGGRTSSHEVHICTCGIKHVKYRSQQISTCSNSRTAAGL